MKIEYEATFYPVDKNKIREKLGAIKADLVRSEYLQKREVFFLPKGHEIEGGWLRVRNEGDKITMSLKVVSGVSIEDQKEICLTVDSYEQATLFLESLGCQRKAFQESKRELWRIGDVDVCIDEWPWLEPFVEIEGQSEKEVRVVSEALGFDFSRARFCATGTLFAEKYNLPEEVFNHKTELIIFGGKNPFLDK